MKSDSIFQDRVVELRVNPRSGTRELETIVDVRSCGLEMRMRNRIQEHSRAVNFALL